ncbi:MAG: FAD:protein FMN transferase, partial [Boseongicola sp.]
VGHIIDPRTGLPASGTKQVSVSAETAAVADGLSTALCLLDRCEFATALQAFEGVRLESRIV